MCLSNVVLASDDITSRGWWNASVHFLADDLGCSRRWCTHIIKADILAFFPTKMFTIYRYGVFCLICRYLRMFEFLVLTSFFFAYGRMWWSRGHFCSWPMKNAFCRQSVWNAFLMEGVCIVLYRSSFTMSHCVYKQFRIGLVSEEIHNRWFELRSARIQEFSRL